LWHELCYNFLAKQIFRVCYFKTGENALIIFLNEDEFMKNNLRHTIAKLLATSTVLSVSLLGSAAHADATSDTKTEPPKDWTTASGLLDAAGVSPNESSFMKNLGLTVGGWVEASVSANFNNQKMASTGL
jgi:hypothetical protein